MRERAVFRPSTRFATARNSSSPILARFSPLSITLQFEQISLKKGIDFSLYLFIYYFDQSFVDFVASDSLHAEDMEIGIWRAHACGERILAPEI